MKIFSTLQKNVEIIGIGPHQQPFNWHSSLSIFINSFGVVLNVAYFFCEANTFQEYAESIFVGTCVIVLSIVFVYFVRNSRIIYDCLDEAEKNIDDSEFGSILTK